MMDTRQIAIDLRTCALSWEPQACLLGNVTANEIAKLTSAHIARVDEIEALQARIAELEAGNSRIGRWMEGAMDDPEVCDEMKSDVCAWWMINPEATQTPAKPFDFDKLFSEARKTAEYWKERHELLTERIAELEAERRWISVDERLPLAEFVNEDHGVIDLFLVCGIWDKDEPEPNPPTAVPAQYSTNRGWLYLSGKPYPHARKITHWKPLPEPPEVTA